MASTASTPGGVRPGGVSPVGPTLQVVSSPYAGVAHRIGAYLIDVILSFCVLLAAGYTVHLLFAAHIVKPVQVTDAVTLWANLGAGLKLAVLLGYILGMGPIYFALFESSPWQATFGKRLLSIHVTGNDGQRITLARSSSRWISRFLCGIFGGSLASIVTIAVTENRKALHDYLASTLVLKGRPAASGPLGAWRILAAFGLSYLGILAMYLVVFSTFFSTLNSAG